MKVFLSWSGNRSKAVAETLGAWSARVVQAVEPWISSDMEKGARWPTEVADHLEEAKVGIVCLTASNLNEPWILFEAGALSKTKESYVCTFLLDIAPADVEPPLGQFQHTVFSKNDMFLLMKTVNDAVQKCGEKSLTDENLAGVFEVFWPQLETELLKIKKAKEEEPVQRPERQLLEEILEILRAQEQRRQASVRSSWPGLISSTKGRTRPETEAMLKRALEILREKKVSDQTESKDAISEAGD
jgi:hypothetical protein